MIKTPFFPVSMCETHGGKKCIFDDNYGNKIFGSLSNSVRIIIQSVNSAALSVPQSSGKYLITILLNQKP